MLVRCGVTNGRGIGVVQTNDYTDDGWSEDKIISVYWINKQEASLQGQTDRHGFGRAGKGSGSYQAFKQTLGYSDTLKLIDGLAGEIAHPRQSVDEAPNGTDIPLNLVLYGPPGTSKTFDAVSLSVETIDGHANEERKELKARYNELRKAGRAELVTFHQNYAYEDFIEGIRPVLKKKKKQKELRYELRNGVFKRMVKRAQKDPNNRYVLIIDEINRGNIAKIFGELITLIEPSKRVRGEDETYATLPYSQESFSVPDNLYLIGTMNTADRGITELDVALRRRFKFVPMMPDVNHVQEDIEGVDGRELLRAINGRIVETSDRDHQIGHTYFMGVRTVAQLREVFQTQVIPLLQEFFYDDWEKMWRVLNESDFITKREGADRPVFDVLAQDDERWLSAEHYQAIYDSNSGADEE